MYRRDLKQRLRGVMQSAQAAANFPETSREQLLAVSEYARRLGGDSPGNGDLADLTLFELRGVLPQRRGRRARRDRPPHRGAGAVLRRGGRRRRDREQLRGARRPGRVGRPVHRGQRCRDGPAAPQVRPDPTGADAAGDGHAGDRRRPARRARRPGGAGHLLGRRRRERLLDLERAGAPPAARGGGRVQRLDPAGRRVVQPRDKGPWDGSDFYGASIDAFVALGAEKGYRLVHCDLTGANAFFVRDDLPGDYPT